ncbi:MAG: hypothetical protein JKY42_03565 [Flavobacteriales bacterium]|nr:hypothetical protein [Flavobacteriales bacterium]
MRKIAAFILFLLPVFCYGQYKYTALYNPSWKYALADTADAEKVKVKEKKHSKFLFSIDSRNSGMDGEWVKIFGLDWVWKFANVTALGLVFMDYKNSWN